MDVSVQRKQQQIIIILSGVYQVHEYSVLLQQFAEVECSKECQIVISCTSCTGNAFQLHYVLMVVAKHFSGVEKLEFELPQNVKEKAIWFEPVWSKLIKEKV